MTTGAPLARRVTAAGLWPVAVLSAAVVPAFVYVAHAHRGHWTGAAATAFWPAIVVPWAARLWPLMVLPALVGAAGSVRAAHPRAGARLLDGAAAGLLLAFVAGLAALPSWVWLVRLDVGPATAVLAHFGRGWAALVFAALVTGAAAGGTRPAVAVVLGASAGASALAWVWVSAGPP